MKIQVAYDEDGDDYSCGGARERIIVQVCRDCWDGFSLPPIAFPDQPTD